MNRLPHQFWLALFVATLLVALATPAIAGEIQGKVMSVDPDDLAFVIKTDASGKVLPFHLDEDATIYINQVESSLSDLHQGDEVSIVHRQVDDNWLAIVVHCERK